MRHVCVILTAVLLSCAVLSAQEAIPEPQPPEPALTQPVVPAAPAVTTQPAKKDALLLYNQGRKAETAGQLAEASARYREAIAVCDAEIATDPYRMDAHTVKCWSLFRLKSYKDVVNVGTASLRLRFDARIVECMGEAYYFLGDNQNALRSFQRYVDNVGEFADRVSTAYFYMAESYMRLKRFDHADIAYGLAVHREPTMARWWYRYGNAVEALGEYPRAYELYGRALKLSPDMQEAQTAQTRVRGLY